MMDNGQQNHGGLRNSKLCGEMAQAIAGRDVTGSQNLVPTFSPRQFFLTPSSPISALCKYRGWLTLATSG